MIDESALTVYDVNAIQLLLPHRYPFLLVDRIVVIDPGKHVVGSKRLTYGEWWTGGGRDLPFSLLLEALAQAGGALIRDLTGGVPGAIAYFMGAERVRMRGAARIGDELSLDVRLKLWKRGICRTRAVARVGERIIMRAELTTIVRAG
jgi:3-hydroxyacyl-[acyl-carrier-protein] dehydratase